MPAVPSVNKWLANDTQYQATTNALAKALKDYKTRMNQQLGQYDTEYNQNVSTLGTSRQAALTDTENDYAGRGILRSGVYANTTSNLMSDYNARQNRLDTGRANFRADMTSAEQDFKSEQNLANQNARQNAINRRAARYGI